MKKIIGRIKSLINLSDPFSHRAASMLTRNMAERDAAGLDYTLHFIFANKIKLDEQCTDVLMQLLEDETWHTKIEDIISLLEDIKDPKSIELLYKTAINVPDYDEMRSVAKKCLWALLAINTPEAMEKIYLLKRCDDVYIRDGAAMVLSKKENEM